MKKVKEVVSFLAGLGVLFMLASIMVLPATLVHQHLVSSNLVFIAAVIATGLTVGWCIGKYIRVVGRGLAAERLPFDINDLDLEQLDDAGILLLQRDLFKERHVRGHGPGATVKELRMMARGALVEVALDFNGEYTGGERVNAAEALADRRGDLGCRSVKLDFEEAWAAMEAKGFDYNGAALEQVRLGFDLARGVIL